MVVSVIVMMLAQVRDIVMNVLVFLIRMLAVGGEEGGKHEHLLSFFFLFFFFLQHYRRYSIKHIDNYFPCLDAYSLDNFNL